MDTCIDYRDGALHIEAVAAEALAARHGTPCYVYSRAGLEQAWREYDGAFGERPHRVCYAVKANSNLAVLDVLARLGSGFDVVSAGELRRVLAAGGRAADVVFSGVGKRTDELEFALEAGIACFDVESTAEIERLDAVARRLGRRAPVALRVNPEVDPRTHPYIATGLRESKFGIAWDEAPALCRAVATRPGLHLRGLACHIGSQLTDAAPLREAAARMGELARGLAGDGLPISHIDLGGGLGVCYDDERPVARGDLVAQLLAALGPLPPQTEIVLEPGRSIAATAGVLLTRVEYLKPGPARSFAIVDAAMNDLLRPSLYQAWHAIRPVRPRQASARLWDVVGPVCESGDILGRERVLALEPGDLLAIFGAGAYGFVMSSQYNTRPRAAEVMVDGEHSHLVRERERFEDLIRGERRLP